MNEKFKIKIFNVLFLYSFYIVLAIAVFTISFGGERFINLNKYIKTFTAINVILLFVIVIFLIYSKQVKCVISYIDLFYFLWILNNVFSYFIYHSYNMSKLAIYIFSFIFYLLIKCSTTYLSKDFFLKNSSNFLAIICSTECVIILLQYWGYLSPNDNLFTVTGTFKNPAPAALFLVACFSVFVNQIVFETETDVFSRKLNYLTIILIISIIPLTKNRTSWLGISIWLVYVINLRYSIYKKLSEKLGRSFLNILLCISLIFIVILFYKFNSSSIAGRILIWKISIHQVLFSPIFGCGFGSFSGNYNKWQADYLLNSPETLNFNILGNKIIDTAGWVRMAYNEYLEILVETGIIGLILFFLLIYNVLKSYLMRNTANNNMLTNSFGIFIIILISSLFSYPFYSLATFLLFNFSIAIISGYSVKKITIYSTYFKIFSKLSVSLLLIISLFSLYYLFNTNKAYNNYILAYKLNGQGEFDKSYQYYERCSILRNDPNYLVDYGINLLNNKKFHEAIETFKEVKNYDNDVRIYMILGNLLKETDPKNAESNFKTGTMITPTLVFPKFQLFKFYLENNDTLNCKKIGENIINTKEKVPNKLYDIILDSTKYYLKGINGN